MREQSQAIRYFAEAVMSLAAAMAQEFDGGGEEQVDGLNGTLD
jgi:hypothetical protein